MAQQGKRASDASYFLALMFPQFSRLSWRFVNDLYLQVLQEHWLPAVLINIRVIYLSKRTSVFLILEHGLGWKPI